MLQELLHLFFPVTCLCCENVLQQQEQHICFSCLHSLPFLEEKQDPVIQKLAGRIRAKTSFSLFKFNKQGMAQQLLHELKYRQNPELGIFLGRLMAESFQKSVPQWEIDYLVPVPLHSKKLAQRGYNQAEQIAKGFSEVLNIPVNTTLLVKAKENQSQTKKGRLARIANLKDCYEAKEIQDASLNIALVDDVITTGATFEACAKALEKKGLSSVSVLTIAVA